MRNSCVGNGCYANVKVDKKRCAQNYFAEIHDRARQWRMDWLVGIVCEGWHDQLTKQEVDADAKMFSWDEDCLTSHEKQSASEEYIF